MCKFFSFVENGRGRYLFLNYEQRKELHFEVVDSHSRIVKYFVDNGELNSLITDIEAKFNKWEYNPLTKKLVLDYDTGNADEESVRKWVEKLDFALIVPELVIKPIINPFLIERSSVVTEREIELLKEWISIRTFVWDSVGTPVRFSIWNSVRDSVWNSFWDSVSDSVSAFVWNSVSAFVWNSVSDSVRDSVWDSTNAYISSFFNLKEWEYVEHEEGANPFQSCIDLWEAGLVPSFDGKTWRLHAGENAEVVYELNV